MKEEELQKVLVIQGKIKVIVEKMNEERDSLVG